MNASEKRRKRVANGIRLARRIADEIEAELLSRYGTKLRSWHVPAGGTIALDASGMMVTILWVQGAGSHGRVGIRLWGSEMEPSEFDDGFLTIGTRCLCDDRYSGENWRGSVPATVRRIEHHAMAQAIGRLRGSSS